MVQQHSPRRIDFVDSIRLLSCLSRLFVVLIIGLQLHVVFDALPSRIKIASM